MVEQVTSVATRMERVETTNERRSELLKKARENLEEGMKILPTGKRR